MPVISVSPVSVYIAPAASLGAYQAGEQVGQLAVAAYQLSQSKTTLDYINGGYSLAAALTAGTALGPYVQGAALALQIAEGLGEYIGAQHKKEQLKRDINYLTSQDQSAIAAGHDPGVAAAIALRATALELGSRSAVGRLAGQAVLASPYIAVAAPPAPGSDRRAVPKGSGLQFIDPETGARSSEAELLAKYGYYGTKGEIQRVRAEEESRRIAPGAGTVPTVLTRRSAEE